MTSLVWLRRDLRLHDHAALATALAEPGEVQPVFIFDTDILARFTNREDRRLSFIADALCRIDAVLEKRGGRLLVFRGTATTLIPAIAQALEVTAVITAEDFEPATRARDAAVATALPKPVRFIQVLDHLLRAPQRNVKGDGTPYKVFTPFYKVWRQSLGPEDLSEYKVKDHGRYRGDDHVAYKLNAAKLHPVSCRKGAAHLLKEIGYDYRDDPLWKAEEGPKRLKEFVAHRLANYATARDMLPIIGTSQISPYLRHGLVSVRECMQAALGQPGGEKWISELGWREFYATILYHFPEVVEQEFTPAYRGQALGWSYDKHNQEAFFAGKTGYPVVDAAVREMLATGYMHNRARMIVSSFMTKDLFLDWRIGEEFFAQHLMDYELASNNGGWQWGASTGTDAAPYFRLFNPVLQSRKFDPNGDYIRRYVPELRDMPDKQIHAPWESPLLKPKGYPDPIVDHGQVKDRVMQAFRGARGAATVD